jgi:hypothetical protein
MIPSFSLPTRSAGGAAAAFKEPDPASTAVVEEEDRSSFGNLQAGIESWSGRSNLQNDRKSPSTLLKGWLAPNFATSAPTKASRFVEMTSVFGSCRRSVFRRKPEQPKGN